MRRKKYLIFGFLAILAIAIYFLFFIGEEIWSKEKIINHVADVNTTGSGYPDLEGKFIEYEYNDFGGFTLAFYDNKLLWQGHGGYFDGVTAKVIPQVSKIDNGIYFLSWVFATGGGDNVVVNFRTNRVFAHLHQIGAALSTPFELINGKIICGPSIDCNAPKGRTTNILKIENLITANAQKFSLPDNGTMERPLIAEHKVAREELNGKIVKYITDKGTISIQVNENVTKVIDEAGNSKEYQTHITKIDEGVYFISWLTNEEFGEHIVFNQNTMQVFDQISPNGTSKEQIYKVSK